MEWRPGRKTIHIRYALALRCEFVPVGQSQGPFRNLYFKIFPKGTCNIPGCIVGFPVLDSAPYGLGHRVHHTVHGFDELRVSLPRLELGRRSEYTAALAKYLESSGSECYGLVDRQCFLRPGECQTLRAAAHREETLAERLSAVAIADGESIILKAGEEALVSAVWDRAIPSSEFTCESCSGSEFENGLDAAPGLCPGKVSGIILSVRNDTQEDIEVTRGTPSCSCS